MTDEEIEEAVVDAGLCEAVDNQCGHVLKTAVEKACKAAGLAFENLAFKPFAMWEDWNDICSFPACDIGIAAVD